MIIPDQPEPGPHPVRSAAPADLLAQIASETDRGHVPEIDSGTAARAARAGSLFTLNAEGLSRTARRTLLAALGVVLGASAARPLLDLLPRDAVFPTGVAVFLLTTGLSAIVLQRGQHSRSGLHGHLTLLAYLAGLAGLSGLGGATFMNAVAFPLMLGNGAGIAAVIAGSAVAAGRRGAE